MPILAYFSKTILHDSRDHCSNVSRDQASGGGGDGVKEKSFHWEPGEQVSTGHNISREASKDCGFVLALLPVMSQFFN